MVDSDQKQLIEKNKRHIWGEIRRLEEKPIYPAIMQRVLITAHEEEYFDHDLEYEEKYTEWLELREGFIISHLTEKSNLLGIGDAVILDISKNILMRCPRVTRCGLILPMISYQGSYSQPQDYLTYFEEISTRIRSFQDSAIKKSLRC